MNIGEIAERFIRAAEIDRNSHEHVGPAPLRAQQLPYVHDFADKAGWRKELGDKLLPGADPLSDERKAFWERLGITPSAKEISELEVVHAWLVALDDEKERRALWAWARSKAGGKSFRRWCFKVEHIHPETGRRRKDRAIAKIQAAFGGKAFQHYGRGQIRVLLQAPQIDDIPDTFAEDVGRRDGLNHWLDEDAFTRNFAAEAADFSWAEKRNERRRQQAKAAKRKMKAAA